MRKDFYNTVTNFFDTNLLSIFLGLISGFGINIVSGNMGNNRFSLAALLSSVTIICIVILIRLRQSMDNEVSSRQNDKLTPKEKWKLSSGYEDWKKWLYISSLFVGITAFSFCIYQYIIGNKIAKKEQAKERTEITRRLNTIESLENSNNTLLLTVLDSLKTLK